MTPSAVALLHELVRHEQFDEILAEAVAIRSAEQFRDLRNAIRAGDAHQAALCEGRLSEIETLPTTFKRLAERYKALTPDRS